MPLSRIFSLLAVSLTLIAPAGAQTTFSDDFSSGGYSGSTGSGTWITSWTEFGESDGPTSGDVRITSSGGQNVLRFKDNSRGLDRRLSLAGADVATLSFGYRYLNLDDAQDYLFVAASADDGANWTELTRIVGPGTMGDLQQESVDLTAFVGDEVLIGFFTSDQLGNKDHFLISEVSIAASAASPTASASNDTATTGAGQPVDILLLGNDGAGAGQAPSTFDLASSQPILDGRGGSLYIPLTPGDSGLLGETNGSGEVGLNAGSVTLTDDDTSTGSVTFDITFDRGSPLLPYLTLDADGTALTLLLEDLDFVPVAFSSNGLDLTFGERVEIGFLAETGQSAPSGTLVLDESTYGDFRDDGFGSTNNTSVQYTIPFSALGATESDVADLEADGEFGIRVTLFADLTSTDTQAGSSNEVTLTNGPESFQGAFTLAGVARSLPVVSREPSNGIVDLDPETGIATYTPASTFVGTDTFEYEVCDADNSCDAAEASVRVLGNADLSLSATTNNPTPEVGSEIEVEITLTNDGPYEAEHVVVTLEGTDGLDAGPVTVSQGTYDSGARTWTLPAQAIGSSWLRFSGTITGSTWTQNAEITASQSPDPDSAPGGGAATEDDIHSFTISAAGSSGGASGGLESDGRLAGKIANLLVKRRKSAQSYTDSGIMPRPIPFDRSQVVATKSAEAASIMALIPEVGPEGTSGTLVSPGDLLPVTNAREIVAVDYVRQDGRRLGVVFASTTDPGTVYEHTKVVCDRLAGATLDAVTIARIQGGTFVATRLIQTDGSVDNALSFAAASTAAGFEVDSRFLLGDYAPSAREGVVFNFQVWSVSPEYSAQLVSEILDRLNAQAPVSHRPDSVPVTVPDVFVRSAEYDRGTIQFELQNAEGAESLTLSEGSVTLAESSPRQTFEAVATVPEAEADLSRQSVTVQTGSLFDVDFTLTNDETSARDLLYLADGTWTSVADPNSTIESFAVESGEHATDGPNTWTVERNAYAEGQVSEWAGVFRYLKATGRPIDLSAYDHVAFNAYGQGSVQIVLEKASLQSSDQYAYTIDLTPDVQQFSIPLSEFALRDGSKGLVADDLVLLSFYTYGPGTATPFSVNVSEVQFSLGAATGLSTDIETPRAFQLQAAYPNPFNPQTNISFALETASKVNLTVFDGLGREVAVLQDGFLSAGVHTSTFNAGNLPSGTYLYRLWTPGRTETRTMVLLK